MILGLVLGLGLVLHPVGENSFMDWQPIQGGGGPIGRWAEILRTSSRF